MQATDFKSIAHCAMHFMYHYPDWNNKRTADAVKVIMGSKTGPGNISWYKVKLKKGELKINDFADTSAPPIEPKKEKKIEVVSTIKLLTAEEIADRCKPGSIQFLAFEFIREKNSSTFDPLYKRMKPGMLHHAMNILKNQDAADDAVSVAFTKIWTKIDQYNSKWNFSTWAYKIVRNEALQQVRKKKTVSMEKAEGGSHSDDVQLVEYSSPRTGEFNAESPEWFFDEDPRDLQQIVYEKVMSEIQELPSCYKEVMIDREIKGMKYKQIAKKHNININSVKTKIKRARLCITQQHPDYTKLVKNKNRARSKRAKKMVSNFDI